MSAKVEQLMSEQKAAFFEVVAAIDALGDAIEEYDELAKQVSDAKDGGGRPKDRIPGMVRNCAAKAGVWWSQRKEPWFKEARE